MATGLLFALLATVLNSGAALLESDATRQATHRPLATRPRYLVGLLVDGLGWAATVVALRFLPVFVVQAVLGGAIALTAVGARLLYRTRLRRVDRLACVACVAGLALVAASAGADQPSAPSALARLVLLAVAALLLVGLAATWSSRAEWPRTVIAGLGFGGSSVAVRAVHLDAGRDLSALLLAPSVYLVAVFGATGLVGYSRALERGSLTQVTAILLVTEVTVPGVAGIVLLGDSVRPGWWPALVVGLVLAVAGVVVLSGSPAQRPPSAVPTTDVGA